MNNAPEATAAQSVASRPDRSSWVAANAGSGKTTVLANRVARLLLRDIRPEKILCLTYTKAAASVMQNRLFANLGKWAMLPDTELRLALTTLGEPDAFLTNALLKRARTLFASALETPGGLKIQTIHSFCDNILRRFPLESGISPSFALLVENRQRQLIDDVLSEMADSANPAAFDGMVANMTGDSDDIVRLAEAVLSARDDFRTGFDPQHCRAVLGLAAGETVESLYRDILGNGAFALLTEIRAVLSAPEGKDATAAAKIDRILARFDQPATQAALEDLLLTKVSTNPYSAKKDFWAVKATRDKHPQLESDAYAFAQRVEAGREKRLSLSCFAATSALHEFAGAFLDRYDRHKAERGLLDFDDQVRRVRDLLTRGSAAQWVLYKLDGGIEHVLVDEAQDTSPTQWDVVKSLSGDFFAGAAASRKDRTIFVVGDEKQSIYSFQGADPAAFGDARGHFARLLEHMAEALQGCDLIYSFRSSQIILDFVDRIMQAHVPGLAPSGQHLAVEADKPGRIELWDLVGKDKADVEPPWFDPADMPSQTKPAIKLAEKIADWINEKLANQTILGSGDSARQLCAGDILILVQSRGPLYRALLRAIKARGLPVSGADRYQLTEEIAVKDLLSTLRFVASPFDDLALAESLKSPLCGLSEADLFRLAHGRGELTLWDRLLACQTDYPGPAAMFSALRGSEGFLRPFELLEWILFRFGGQAKLLGRLGNEAREGIDELLSQALAYENIEAPSLIGFLEWIGRGETELKRQHDEFGQLIRVMTVHGAKGLESPLVILPDTAQQSSRRGLDIHQLPGGPLAWAAVGDGAPAAFEAARRAAANRAAEERQRLFYVALTRAANWLVICGAESRTKSEDCWYQQAANSVSAMEFRRDGDALVLGQDWQVRQDDTVPPEPSPAAPILPVWALETVDPPARRSGPISPSMLGGAHSAAGESLSLEDDAGLKRGRWIHALLERLPDLAAETRRPAAAFILRSDPEPPDDAELTAVYDEVAALLDHVECRAVFAPGSLAEAPFIASTGDRQIAGRIDRLLIAPELVRIIDFKTNRIVPEQAENVPEGILRQMGAYSLAMSQIWPNRRIEAAILWTWSAKLMVLPQNIVMEAFARREEP